MRAYIENIITTPLNFMNSENIHSGNLFIVSAPSGAGKSTLCRALLDTFADIQYSVSFTTRRPRAKEKNGVHYHFIDKQAFEKGIATGRWAEWAEVHGNYYGSDGDFINKCLADGGDILLDIDVQGTRQILERYPESITIFILPPSLDTLAQRLELRDADSQESIALRLKNAEKEIAQKDLYRHEIVNDRLPEAVAQLTAIVERYRSGR